MLGIAGVAEDLIVSEFRGKEALSQPFRFDLEVQLPREVDPKGIGFAAARLRLEVGGTLRLITGEIEAVRRGELLAGGLRRVRIRVGPRLRRLDLRRNSRVFQDMSTRSVISEILDEHGVRWRAALTMPHPLREICIQHDETDLAFVERLCAEEGIAYRFEAPTIEAPANSEESVVFFDEPADYPPLLGGDKLAYRPEPVGGQGLVREEHYVSEFLEQERRRPTGVQFREFDFRRPQQVVRASDPAETNPLAQVLAHHGAFGEMQIAPGPPEVVREQVRRRARLQEGRSACARLAPGSAFSLDDHEDASLQGQYAVMLVRHHGRGDSDAESSYENRFETIRRPQLHRPARPARKVRQSLETAIVTGPPGEEIHTDALGRIKVRFHWDSARDNDDATSCWIRVAQSWAGVGWGAQFIPRIGMEVVIAFLGGDPDRPLVVGCLPNATHPPAFSLPGNKTRSGFRTRSTPDNENAGSNELCFEDAAGAERVNISAKRDLEFNVENDFRTTVSGDALLQVACSQEIVIAGSHRMRVEGPASTSFGAGGEVSVAGDLEETIEGNHDENIGASAKRTIEGSEQITVQGDRKETVAGPWTQEAESLYTMLVGGPENNGHAEVQIRGSSVHTSETSAVFEARESLTLICGESRIELTPHSISISAPIISLKAKSLSAEGEGPALRLTDRAEIFADELKLYGKESSLELDRDATLKGNKIYLNCDPTPPDPEDKEGKPTTQKLSVRLSDELFRPYTGKHFELRADSLKLEGTTGDQGQIEADVPKSARIGHVSLWTKEFPTGPKKTYTLVITPLEPPDTLPGMRARLKNLGYFQGRTEGDELDAETKAALRQFQLDHQLEVTGLPDTATQALVVQRHGH